MKTQWKLATAVVASSVLLAGCASGGQGTDEPAGDADHGVVLMVPGALGDLGFLDSSAEGLEKAGDDYGISTRVIEGGVNASATWQSNFQQLSNADFELVVSASALAADQLTEVATENTEQQYVSIDTAIDLPNVTSITFKQSDGAFLAGVIAGLASTDADSFSLSGGSHNVGFIGGLDIPVIQDFLAGFTGGAQAIDPDITVQTSFVGGFTDSQTAYNQAMSMYANGADVIFAAAGGAGQGVLKASNDAGKYSVGVDSNQNDAFPENVLGSVLKNSGTALYEIVGLLVDGSLDEGSNYVYGIGNGGIEMVLNDALVSEDVAAQVQDYTDQVKSGAIDVPCVEPYCTAPNS